jgi:hypothetical protein
LERFAKELWGNTTIQRFAVSPRIQALLEEFSGAGLLAALEGLRNLQHLIIGRVTLDVLIRLDACHDKIEFLQTECFHATSLEEETLMVDLLSKWKSLRSMLWTTSSSSHQRVSQLTCISQILPSYLHLQVAHLSHTGLKEFHPSGALGFIGHCLKLQELKLRGWKFTTDTFSVLATGVKSHPSLHTLEVSRCEIAEAGWWTLMDALETNRSLVRLSIVETSILRDITHEAYPTRVIWERIALVLQDHNDCLEEIAPMSTLRVVSRLLALNRSGYRRRLGVEHAKLGPHLVAMASQSPRFIYSLLRNNVEILLTRNEERYDSCPTPHATSRWLI